jgi:hypothetical protein
MAAAPIVCLCSCCVATEGPELHHECSLQGATVAARAEGCASAGAGVCMSSNRAGTAGAEHVEAEAGTGSYRVRKRHMQGRQRIDNRLEATCSKIGESGCIK